MNRLKGISGRRMPNGKDNPSDSGDRSDYGPASLPPNTSASLLLAQMTGEEKRNLFDLLGIQQKYYDEAAGQSGYSLHFHPEARNIIWGAALAKVADHFQEIGSLERSLFFMEAAWNISSYPPFARNAAFLALSLNDLYKAHSFLYAFVESYRATIEPRFGLFGFNFKEGELEQMATEDREKISIISSGRNPLKMSPPDTDHKLTPVPLSAKEPLSAEERKPTYSQHDGTRNLTANVERLVVADFALPGLSPQQSLTTICAHLFEPRLLKWFITPSLAMEWCSEWISSIIESREDEAVKEYERFEKIVREEILSEFPSLSLAEPPFSIASHDGRLPSLPWRTPGHAQTLIDIITGRSSNVTPFGEMFQIAFITDGGPGETKQTAFRVRARAQFVRASCEHWIMRLFKASYAVGTHFSLAPDSEGRLFSRHDLTAPNGQRESMFFVTTHSKGREQEDFLEFLDEYDSLVRTMSANSNDFTELEKSPIGPTDA